MASLVYRTGSTVVLRIRSGNRRTSAFTALPTMAASTLPSVNSNRSAIALMSPPSCLALPVNAANARASGCA
jgi:hypothetical protein